MERTKRASKDLSRFKIHQNKPTAEYARKALPIMVECAIKGETITYGKLGERIGRGGARLQYEMFYIGEDLITVARELGLEIPPLNVVVVNNKTGAPARGIMAFANELKMFLDRLPDNYDDLNSSDRKRLFEKIYLKLREFKHWDKVLDYLGLQPLSIESIVPYSPKEIKRAYKKKRGEGPRHKRLKEYIRTHPQAIGLPANYGRHGISEFLFHSTDEVDVLFKHPREWVGVEVKARNADEKEITRGLFQCVKYQALLEATARTEYVSVPCRIVLVIEDSFPVNLLKVQEILGVQYQTVRVPK